MAGVARTGVVGTVGGWATTAVERLEMQAVSVECARRRGRSAASGRTTGSRPDARRGAAAAGRAGRSSAHGGIRCRVQFDSEHRTSTTGEFHQRRRNMQWRDVWFDADVRKRFV